MVAEITAALRSFCSLALTNRKDVNIGCYCKGPEVIGGNISFNPNFGVSTPSGRRRVRREGCGYARLQYVVCYEALLLYTSREPNGLLLLYCTRHVESAIILLYSVGLVLNMCEFLIPSDRLAPAYGQISLLKSSVVQNKRCLRIHLIYSWYVSH